MNAVQGLVYPMLLHIVDEVDRGLMYFLERTIGAIPTWHGEAKSIHLVAILLGGILVIKHLLYEIKRKLLATSSTMLLFLLGWLRLFLNASRMFHWKMHVLRWIRKRRALSSKPNFGFLNNNLLIWWCKSALNAKTKCRLWTFRYGQLGWSVLEDSLILARRRLHTQRSILLVESLIQKFEMKRHVSLNRMSVLGLWAGVGPPFSEIYLPWSYKCLVPQRFPLHLLLLPAWNLSLAWDFCFKVNSCARCISGWSSLL